MTPAEKDHVRASFALVEPIAAQAGALFYGRLFELDPSLRPLFRGDMAEQSAKLMAMIATVTKNLDNPGVLVPAVQSLGKRHAGYGVQDSHYATVGAALIWTLGQGLGDKFTPEVEGAWVTAYTFLSGVMQEAARH
ncbi:globin family protein [Plastoroseomonas arctica]|uniref:Hemin receptor n=1 Tax=Plastoroseomonas arctica TaxID=1509237 RepID=A0AAF1K0G2_9PROT|nr:globin family protein [Plastoroseomonas arctica]MBR0654756.1 hemin receptor [Plastoroseomonas arctica]